MRNNKKPSKPFVVDFEAEAEAFLRKYCKEVLDTPQATPIRDIAQKRMSLDIVDTERLSSDDSIQGAIIFSAGIMDVYDCLSEEYVGYEVSRPTIFLDAGIINQGRLNNTLAHECYHWYKHRAYFRYQSRHKPGTEFAFRSLITEQINSDEKRSDIERMEWQARTIAPKILMPRCTVRTMLSERLGATQNGNADIPALKAVIEEMVETYQVSRQSAAIRLAEFGYPEAIKLYENETIFADRQHWRGATAAKRRYQPIDIAAAFQLYTENEHLKAMLDTGVFCYAEGYFVLRDEKYVLRGETGLVLTEYAKTHLSECTLDFSYKWVRSCVSADEKQYMFREDSYIDSDIEPKFVKLPDYRDYKDSAEHDKAMTKALNDIVADFNKQFERRRKVSESTSARMCEYMDDAHWNSTTFRDRTLLSEMAYSRVRKNHKFGVPSYTAMAVGLELTLHETEDALRLSGLGYDDNNRIDNAYMFILSACHGSPIDECNVVLEHLNVGPLGNKDRKENKEGKNKKKNKCKKTSSIS